MLPDNLATMVSKLFAVNAKTGRFMMQAYNSKNGSALPIITWMKKAYIPRNQRPWMRKSKKLMISLCKFMIAYNKWAAAAENLKKTTRINPVNDV